LVVDDDPEVRWVTAEALRAIGYEVTEAASGRTALTLLERGDPCDLIIMDLAMPGLSGAETVRLARRMRPDLSALFCTGNADASGFESETGGDPLLAKPFGPDALAEAVRKALGETPAVTAANVVQLRRSEPSQSR
jgi:CheY-like chemotaxis protein